MPVPATEVLLESATGGTAGAKPPAAPLASLVLTALTDHLGRFSFTNLRPGDYRVTLRKPGFFVLAGQPLTLRAGQNEVSYTLNHEQELHEKVEVSAGAGRMDPEETAQRATLLAREIRDVPVPNTHTLLNSLVVLPDIVRDNAGAIHVAGARTGETQYLLDGFEIGDPATGGLNARFSVDATRSAEVQAGRFGSGYAHPGAGILTLDSISGDDRWRFGTTNFIPGIHVERGWHLGNWYPRFQFSGPLARGRAWFSEAVSLQHTFTLVKQQPPGADETSQWAGQSLLRLQGNLTPRHILSASYLYNRESGTHLGLDAFDPVSTTLDAELRRSFVALKDQLWLHSTLITLGFAVDSGVLERMPQGSAPYVLTPAGSSGNYFERLRRRGRRLQGMGSVAAPSRRWHGTHELAAGFNVNALAFSQAAMRGEMDVLRGDGTLARLSTFSGNAALRLSNTQAGGYVQDTWKIAQRLIVQAGVRADWDRLVQHAMAGPHVAVNILPFQKEDTAKLSLGWSLTNAPLDLSLLGRAGDQAQVDTFYDASGVVPVAGPAASRFALPAGGLTQPRFATTSAGWQQKIGKDTLLGVELLARNGRDGLVYAAQQPGQPGTVFVLQNTRRDRYRSATFSARHAFAQQAELFAGYTRSRAHSNEALDPALGPLQFAAQQSGPLPWDAPNRLLTWGWAQTPFWGLFLSYFFEYRSGYPFGSVDQYQQLAGAANAQRFPDYASLNLGLEKRFQFRGYYWAARISAVNVLARENPETVVNNITAPNYLAFAGGQSRAFTMRLRFVGRK
ncbi:MAG: TonB-dependent receptor [Acidobacteriia bacterium]|nr:TonB-dependent receptor [Terriglobia bacterium]